MHMPVQRMHRVMRHLMSSWYMPDQNGLHSLHRDFLLGR